MSDKINKKIMTHKLFVVCKIFQALLATSFGVANKENVKNKTPTKWEMVNISHTIRVKKDQFLMKISFNLKDETTKCMTKKYKVQLSKKLDNEITKDTDITKLTVDTANIVYLIEFAEKMFHTVYEDLEMFQKETYVECRTKQLS